jgi:peroxiredoxin
MGKARRTIVFIAAIIVTIGVAYVLGVTAAGIVQKYRSKQFRAETTKQILEKMGTGLEVGVTLPDAQLQDLDSNAVDLKDIVGPQSIVSIISADCGACKAQLELYKKELADPAQQSRFILVSSSNSDELRDLQKEFCPNCRFLNDPGSQYMLSLNVVSFPINFVVDQSMTIQDIVVGPPDASTLHEVAEYH